MTKVLFSKKDKKYVFIRIPKTGSTSIVKGVFEKQSFDSIDTQSINIPIHWNTYYKFAFIRNPLCRFFSAYIMFENYNNSDSKYRAFREGFSVDKILDLISDPNICLESNEILSKMKRHFIPFTNEYFKLDLCDHIYRQEEFENAYKSLFCLVNGHKPSEIPHLRKSNVRYKTNEFFTEENWNRYLNIFIEDFKFGNYIIPKW